MTDVARVPPFDRPATYDDLLKLPPHLVAEIVGGELHASARPALPHAWVSFALGGWVHAPFGQGRSGPGGWLILYEPELHLGAEPVEVVVPDLAGWRRSRMPAVPDAPFATLAPDWVCEILSPSTEAFDRARKLGVYGRAGLGHVWLIDPGVRTLEVLRLEGGRRVIVLTAAGTEAIRAEPFAAVELPLETLWP
jgi:hypothetical protein